MTAPSKPTPMRLPSREPRERDIEKKVCDKARRLGFYVRKFNSMNNRSVPDRLMIAPYGLVFFIEFKAPGKKPTVAQEKEIREISIRGSRVFVIDSIKDGEALIDAIKEEDEKYGL